MKKIWILIIFLFGMVPGVVTARPIENLGNSFSLLAVDDKIIETINKEDVTNESYVGCTEKIYFPYQIVSVIRTAQSFIKIGVPIIFIIMGMIDFGKVVLGKADEEMKKAKKSFGARLIAAVLVYLVVAIVEMILPIIDTGGDVLNCTKCIVLDDEHCQYMNITYPNTPVKTPVSTPTVRPVATPTPSPTVTPSPAEEPDPTPEVTPSVSPVS